MNIYVPTIASHTDHMPGMDNDADCFLSIAEL